VGANTTLSLLLIAAVVFAFALLVWAFAVLVWDFLEERTRGWLRVSLVGVLAPSFALAAALATALITSAVITALEPHERPARIEPAKPETTSENTEPEAVTNRTGTPSPSPSTSPAATSSPSASASATSSPSASASP
jgi:hypothetical protein